MMEAANAGGGIAVAGPADLVGPESQFSLRWNNHTSTFCHVLSALRDKDKYSDVTLACDGRFYNVHRLVLGICSDYFDAMLERTPCKHPVIVLKDIKAEDLESLLSYMYVGEVSVSQSDLSRLIKAAELLCIKGLAVPDEPPAGFADTGLASTLVREKIQPGLIYATTNGGNVMTFVAHAPQTQHTTQHPMHQLEQEEEHHQQQSQQHQDQHLHQQHVTNHTSFRTSRSSPLPSKRRRKGDSGCTLTIVSSASMIGTTATPSTTSSNVIDATVSVDGATANALVYQNSPGITSASPPTSSGTLGVNVTVVPNSPCTTPNYDQTSRDRLDHLKEAREHNLLQVVDDSLVKEESMEEAHNGLGSGNGVVASVLTGKNAPTISYVVTTDHAGNLQARPQPHNSRFDHQGSHDGQLDQQGGQGDGEQQPQPLAEAVAEALAGPSGMQSWLSGSELSQTGFGAVESYTTTSSNSDAAAVTEADMKQQHGLDGAAAGITTTSSTTMSTSNNNMTVVTPTTITVATVGGNIAEADIIANNLVGAIIPAKRIVTCSGGSTSGALVGGSTSGALVGGSTSGALVGASNSGSGEGPAPISNALICPYCQRATFRQTSDLKRHIRIHTGEKPYQCRSCQYRASRKDLLHTHCAKIHQYTYTGAKQDGKDGTKEDKESKRKWKNPDTNEWLFLNEN